MTDKRVEIVARALCREWYIADNRTREVIDSLVDSMWKQWEWKAVHLLDDLDKAVERTS